jgi:DNA-directed RNA polymerase specialized sigma24 family protein
MCFYGGYTQKETAEICKISVNLVNNNWAFARSWLLSQLKTA